MFSDKDQEIRWREHMTYIIELIDKHKSDSLSLANAGLFDEDIPNIVEHLNQNSHIKKLDLACNNITDEGGKCLANLKYIKEIDLTRNNLENEGAIALIRNPGIKKINFTRNNTITQKCGEQMAEQATQEELILEGTMTGVDCKTADEIKKKISERVKENNVKLLSDMFKPATESKKSSTQESSSTDKKNSKRCFFW